MEICWQRYAHNGYATLPDTNSQFMGFQDIKTLILVLKEIINSFLQKNYHNPERFRKVHYTSGLFVLGCFLRLSNESMLGCVSIFIDVAKNFIAAIFSVALEAHRRLQKVSSLGLPGLR